MVVTREGLTGSSDTLLTRICDFIGAKRHQLLSTDSAEAMQLRVIDSVGCAVGCLGDPIVETICKSTLRFGGIPESTVIGHELTASDRAAFANGFMIRCMDFNDNYFAIDGGHPSDLVSSALAVGEAVGASGASVLRALSIGYHVLLDCFDATSLISRGWDHTTFGVIASAATAGTLLELPVTQMAHAISLATVPHIALFETRAGQLSEWKGAAFANAARNGIFAAYLAAEGLTGPPRPFEGEYGFIRYVSGPLDLRLDVAVDRTQDSFFKFFPTAYFSQGPIELALLIRKTLGDLPVGDATEVARRIERVELVSHRLAAKIMADTRDKWRPTTRATADHSLPFLVALALGYGRMNHADIETAMSDENVLRIASRLSVREDPMMTQQYPKLQPARLVVSAGGKVHQHEITAPLGHPSRPSTNEVVLEKFRRNATIRLAASTAKTLERRLRSVTSARDIRGLLANISWRTS